MIWIAAIAAVFPGYALDPAGVLVVENAKSAVSRTITEYYCLKRGIPKRNVVSLRTAEVEEIDRATFDREVAAPLMKALDGRRGGVRIDVLVLTKGVPLKIRAGKGGMASEAASVDSELAGIRLTRGKPDVLRGPLKNPYYGAREAFSSAKFGVYLVNRLDGYTFADVKGMIDRAMNARDGGVAVLDAKGSSLDDEGDFWLQRAARRLPEGRVKHDTSASVLSGVQDVIAYASWGSNDKQRKTRDTKMGYLPGAIVTEYVSSDGRTFKEPPGGWEITTWENTAGHFAGSPQSLSADFIRQGASGVSGHVYEPYLAFTPRPDVLLPAYIVERRTLAESYWASIPAVSWMNVVVGDPLCRLGR